MMLNIEYTYALYDYILLGISRPLHTSPYILQVPEYSIYSTPYFASGTGSETSGDITPVFLQKSLIFRIWRSWYIFIARYRSLIPYNHPQSILILYSPRTKAVNVPTNQTSRSRHFSILSDHRLASFFLVFVFAPPLFLKQRPFYSSSHSFRWNSRGMRR